jgi:hypothetical protein
VQLLSVLPSEHFIEDTLRGSRMVSIVSENHTKRTNMACAILLQAITRRNTAQPDVFRFHYASAPIAFGVEFRFADKSFYENVKVLALDNVIRIPDETFESFVSIVCKRSDNGLITILTLENRTAIRMRSRPLWVYIEEGTIIG